MARCLDQKCFHDNLVQAMLGREGEDFLTNAEIEVAAQGVGNPPDFALPNDHSRRFDGKEWCTLVDQCGQQRLAPNKMPWCLSCCYDGIHHIFWSWRDCTIDSAGTHHHDKPNRYKVVDKLYWCDGSIASFVSGTQPSNVDQGTSQIDQDSKELDKKQEKDAGNEIFTFEVIDSSTFLNRIASGWQIKCLVQNHSQKNIRAFRGKIQCFDIFETFIHEFKFLGDVQGEILAGQSNTFDWHWKLDQGSDPFLFLNGRRHRDLILKFKLDTILYADGTRSNFE